MFKSREIRSLSRRTGLIGLAALFLCVPPSFAQAVDEYYVFAVRRVNDAIRQVRILRDLCLEDDPEFTQPDTAYRNWQNRHKDFIAEMTQAENALIALLAGGDEKEKERLRGEMVTDDESLRAALELDFAMQPPGSVEGSLKHHCASWLLGEAMGTARYDIENLMAEHVRTIRAFRRE